MQEACRIIITEELTGLMNVSAPMKYKEICYDILKDASTVIKGTPDTVFFGNGKTLIIAMNMSGLVDVQAPLPQREWCEKALINAEQIIREYTDSGEKINISGFADNMSNANPIS
jgi:hypothetical protein